MPDYSKTIIYKLINYDFPELIYVGSTTNFTKRKQHHKEGCFNENSKKYNIKVYKTIRENGGWDSWSMIKICDHPCESRRESEQEEDRYMIELKSNLHMRRPFQTVETKQQYFDGRKDIKKEYDKIRRTENKEKIKEAKKIAYYKKKEEKIICECGETVSGTQYCGHKKTKKHIKQLQDKTQDI